MIKTRKKTSPILTVSKEQFSIIVKNAKSFSDIMRHFNFSPAGSSYRLIRKRCDLENIDYSHIPLGRGSNLNHTAIPLKDVMTVNSSYSRGTLKGRLIKNGILVNECAICKQKPIWNSIKLVMVLDHINGVRDDNRLENLRLLCPNCNSQQSTFSGRCNKRRNHCSTCGKEITKKAHLCPKCLPYSNRKTVRPDKDILIKNVQNFGYRGTGKIYGVSDKSIRKWISTPC